MKFSSFGRGAGRRRLGLWGLALLPWLCLAGGQNPISNGGFEIVTPDGHAPGWEFLGNVRVESGRAFSGKRALHLVRTADDEGETGLNRAWEGDSGKRGSMLSQVKGAIRFHYLAVREARPGTLAVVVIPMTGKPIEYGGHRVLWRVPESAVGDGKWHEGEFAYDFTGIPRVKWVHVGARLLGPGELWLDDFEWVPEVDGILQVSSLTFEEQPGREGRAGTLAAELSNLGSKPLPSGWAELRVPQGLRTPQARLKVPALAPGASAELRWPVSGERSAARYRLGLIAVTGKRRVDTALLLERSFEPVCLDVGRSLAAPGAPFQVAYRVRNTGHTILRGLSGVRLSAPRGVRVRSLKAAGEILPGKVGPAALWQATVPQPSALVRFRARRSGATQGVETSLAVGSPPSGPPPSPAGSGVFAARGGGWEVIGTDSVRLALFPCAGSRAGFLEVRDGAGRWRRVGVLPRLGRVRTPQGGDAALAFAQCEVRHGPGEATLAYTGETEIGGTRWRARCVLRVSRGRAGVDYRLEVRPGSAVRLSALEGPMLYAGGPGLPARDDAIVPGLEWLVRGEVSSNALDIEPDHPDRIRYVPNPRKVTVPAVGVRFGDTLVGLLWPVPARQVSREIAGRQSLVFASPDRFGGHELEHLMGLMLPGVEKGLGENRRTAEEPLRLAAGRSLVIEAELLARAGAPDALAALDAWFHRYGVPQPLPYPRGSARAEIAFSLKAFGKDRALWNPKWKQWYSDIIVGFRPTLAPAQELLFCAAVLGRGGVADWARSLAAEVLGRRPAFPEYRPHPEALRGQIRAAIGLLESQQPDGNWVFSGKNAADHWPAVGVDYEKLGPAGARAVGLTAANAERVLSAALWSGNPELRAAGLRALAGMERFRVPRAAQVWEVPVHTPDILAAARAAEAYLAGYRLTGKAKYLARARYWARAGLPFVYVWHAADEPVMQGASIPVFGATHYVLSWFGVAVQWNGLEYSSMLYDLAEIDGTFPWKVVADNVLRSAMYQQATEGERLGEWPDAYNLVPKRKGAHGQTPPCFQPTLIIHQTLRGLGYRRTPVDRLVRRGADRLVIRTPARIAGVQWDAQGLRFRVDYPAPEFGAVAVFRLDRPGSVRIDGRQVQESRGSSSGAGEAAASWRWLPKPGWLVLRFGQPGAYRVAVSGVRARPPLALPRPRKAISFSFARGLEGWSAAHDLSPLQVRDGLLTTETTGGDPYMESGPLHVRGRAGDVLVVEMAVDRRAGSNGCAVYWQTAEAAAFSPERTVSVAYEATGRLQTVRLPVGGHEQWRNHWITRIRLDPLSGKPGRRVRVRSIRLVRSRP